MAIPSWSLLWVSVIVSFGGNFPFGYNNIINPAIDVYKQFLNESYVSRYNKSIDDVTFSFIWSTITAIPEFGALLGLLIVPYFCERIGRKWTIILNNVPTVIACLLKLLSHRILSYELFIVARLLWGVNMGVNTAVQGLFLTECSPDRLRGFVASLQELSLCFCCTFGIALGLPCFLGTYEMLDLMLTLPIIPAVVQMAALFFVHDSPKHLFLTKGDVIAAERSILYYHGSNADLDAIKEEFARERMKASSPSLLGSLSIKQCWTNSMIRRGILIGVVANLANVFSGIASYYAFSTEMFYRAGLGISLSRYGTVIMTVVNTVATVISINFVDRVGRRPLLLSSIFLCLLCNCSFVVFFTLNQDIGSVWAAYIACASVLLHSVLFSIGLGPIPWFITTELVPQAARSTAQSITMALHWGVELFDVLVFFPLFYQIGAFSSVLHIVPSAAALYFLYRHMPETKGREIAEILSEPLIIGKARSYSQLSN